MAPSSNALTPLTDAAPADEDAPGCPRSHTVIALVGIFLFVVALVPGAFVGQHFFYSDTHMSFEPLRSQLGDALRQGLPLWSPWLGAGKPILANPTQATCYPPNLLFAVMPAYQAITYLTILHILLGATGAFFLARRLGLAPAEALTAALVVAGSGVSLSAIPYSGLLWCAAWTGWLLLFTDDVARGHRPVRSWLALVTVIFMMITNTEPFVLLAGVLAVALWLAVRILKSEDAWSQRIRLNLVRPGAAGLAAAVLAAPYLIAVATHVGDSVRALGFKWAGVTTWSLNPIHLLEVIAPGAFGYYNETGAATFWATGLNPEKAGPLLISIYLGMPVVALALVALARLSPMRVALGAWLGMLGLAALGRWGPVYYLFALVPGTDGLRYPVKWLVPAMLPLALLVALGMRDLTSGHRPSRYVFLATLGAAAIGLHATAAICYPSFPKFLAAATLGADPRVGVAHADQLTSACQLGLVSIGITLAVFMLARNRPARLAMLLVAVVAGDLLIANHELAPTTSAAFYEHEPVAVSVIRCDPGGFERIWVDTSRSNGLRWTKAEPTLEEIAQQLRQTLDGYVATDYRIPLALTNDTEATGPASAMSLHVLAKSAPPREQAMVLGSAAITHAVVAHVLDHPKFELRANTRTIGGTDLRIYRNGLAQPRVRLVPSVIPYTGDDGYRLAVRSAPDDLFARAALVETDDLAHATAEVNRLVSSATPLARFGTARIVEDIGHRLTVHAETDRPALLVIADVFLPQWSAKVDGTPTPIVRVDYCFRGVPLAAGSHTVTFRYNPWKRTEIPTPAPLFGENSAR